MSDILAAIDNLIEIADEQYRNPGEFTITEFMERYNELHPSSINYGQAKRMLDSLHASGNVTRRIAVVNGKRCKVYLRCE